MKGNFSKRSLLVFATVVFAVLTACTALGQARDDDGPWQGEKGIRESVSQIMGRANWHEGGDILPLLVDSTSHRQYLENSEYSVANPVRGFGGSPFLPQQAGVAFDAITRAVAGSAPPDPSGGVSANQILVCVTGRIRVFDKQGNLGSLDVSTDAFFESVRAGAGTRFGRVRFDRLTNRWFIGMLTTNPISNRVLLAVSDGPEISPSTVFTFFQFQQDVVGPTPNSDTGRVADSLSMGVDANAVYLGANIFTYAFAGSSAFVVKKSSLLSGGPVQVTAFRNLTGSPTGRGIYSPVGVDNDDPAANEGYFIGVDNGLFGTLVVRRVTDPGGAPSLSDNLYVYVDPTVFPMHIPALGSLKRLSATDDRLTEARISKNYINGTFTLWTAHAIQVNASGVASNGGGRTAVRWYQIGNLNDVPGRFQSGTIFDPGANPTSFWMPSVALTGQGHLAIGMSSAKPTTFAGISGAGRLRLDAVGVSQPPTEIRPGGGAYNVDSFQPQRWGSYSSTCMDPTDAMTAWTFQQYANADNSWAVRVIQLKAPPPPVLTVSPGGLIRGQTSDVQISGSVVNGSEFFEPGPDVPNHLSLTIDGDGLTINSFTYISPTQLRINLAVAPDATSSVRTLTVTNPDGQTATFPFEVRNSTPHLYTITPISRPTGSPSTTVTAVGENFEPTSVVTFDGVNRPTTLVSDTELTFELSAEDLALGAVHEVKVVTPGPGVGSSEPKTFTVINPQPVLNALNPASVNVQSPETTITVTGTGFVPNSVVWWNGENLVTTYISPTELSAVINPERLTSARTASIRVFNPSPGGGGSANDKVFTVTNPSPTIGGVSPDTVLRGSDEILITVTGTNFIGSSKIRFAGIDRETTVASSTELRALIPASDLANGGTRTVRVATPGPGGGVAGPLTFFVNNPVPVLGSVIPKSTIAGGPLFLLTVNGADFVPGAVIRWNGLDRTTTVVSSTQLTCNIPASFITNAGYNNITVWNPGPGGGESTPEVFTVDNPIPTILAVAPVAASQFGPGFELTVSGTQFVNGCTVKWRGETRPTTFISTTQITATISDSDLLEGGLVPITVVNPEPGMSESAPKNFTVNFAMPQLEALNVDQVPVGSGDVALEAYGSNFAPTSVIKFGVDVLPSNYVSSTQLNATIPASLLTFGRFVDITVFTPAPGGGQSLPITFSVVNPMPTLTTITPASVMAGGAAFTITVTGSSFVPNSEVLFNGQARPTTFISPTEVRGAISAQDISISGSAAIRVRNPAPGGGTTPFVSLQLVNPVPRLDSISPGFISAGASLLNVTMRGDGFTRTSVGTWKGAAKPTTYISSTEVRITLGPSDMSTVGTGTMRVVNPAPGGGSSDFRIFSVLPVNSQVVFPHTINVLEGFDFMGGLTDLQGTDNLYFGMLNDDITLVANVELLGTSPVQTPTQMRFEYEYSVGRPGLIHQVDLYNFFGARYQRFDSNSAPQSDVFLQQTIPTPSQFVGPSGSLKAKFLWRPINDEDPALDGWVHLLDVVRWHVTP